MNALEMARTAYSSNTLPIRSQQSTEYEVFAQITRRLKDAAAKGPWSYEALNAFLTKPKTYVPGTKMSFAGVKKEADRANLLAYLKSISPDAPPFPTE